MNDIKKLYKQLIRLSSLYDYEYNQAPFNNPIFQNFKQYPHLFILGCIMNRSISSERAWNIPVFICENLESYDINDMLKKEEEWYIALFEENNLHRYNRDQAKYFYSAIHKIKDEYDGKAINIWKNKPSSALFIYRMLQFNGVGVKIATMTANLLVRKFNVKFSDYYNIDISTDVHIKRIFIRTGIVDNNNNNMIIYKAREINLEFPGLIDFFCWNIGRQFCTKNNPNCRNCPISNYCKKNIN